MVTLLKKHVVKSSSSEKLATIEGNVFWKSSCSEKTALQKKWVMRTIAFLKNSLFTKSSSSEMVDAAQKYQLRKSSCSVDIFILNNSFAKKVAATKSSYPKELPIAQ